MIVFTIYKNGLNAGVLGASFSCAVFGVRGSSVGDAGALCSTGAVGVMFRRSLLRSGVRSFVRSVGRSVSRSVSTEWILQSGQAVEGDDWDALDKASA